MVKIEKIGAASAAALIATMGMAPMAMAADLTNETSSYDDAKIIKTVEAPTALDISGDSYTFSFTQKTTGIDTSTGETAATGGTIQPVTVTATQPGTQTLEGAVVLPSASTFAHAGVYVYDVVESLGNGVDSTRYDANTQHYIMRVYVINDGNGGLEYDTNAITVEKVEAVTYEAADAFQAGTTYYVDNAGTYEVADPQPTVDNFDQGTYFVANGGNTKVDPETGFTFLNTTKISANDLSTLDVSKSVSGDFADTTKEFAFTVTIDMPSYYVAPENADITASATSGSISDLSVGNVTDTANGKQIVITGSMNHGDVMHIENLPIGATFTIADGGGEHYYATSTGSYQTALDDESTTDVDESEGGDYALTQQASANRGQSFTIENSSDTYAEQMVIHKYNNKVDVTNVFQDSDASPTGIATMVLPYALVIAIAGAGIYVVARRRQSSED